MNYYLAIETTCDETSLALLEGENIIHCWTWSQVDEFKKWGGVVPSLASELHMKRLPQLLAECIETYPDIWKQITTIVYAAKPGLVGCLLIGKIFAETLAWVKNIPSIGVNHIEAHILMSKKLEKTDFPALGLVVSGGHTSLFKVTRRQKKVEFQLVGATFDDALGEVLDKIGKMLGLEYPAGPKLEKLAKTGQPTYKLGIYSSKKDFNFSFSGLKTDAMNKIKKAGKELNINDFAASVQATVIKVLIKKIKLAGDKYGIKTLLCGGGVISNEFFRSQLKQQLPMSVFFPPKIYCTDNAAMIGILAHVQNYL